MGGVVCYKYITSYLFLKGRASVLVSTRVPVNDDP